MTLADSMILRLPKGTHCFRALWSFATVQSVAGVILVRIVLRDTVSFLITATPSVRSWCAAFFALGQSRVFPVSLPEWLQQLSTSFHSNLTYS